MLTFAQKHNLLSSRVSLDLTRSPRPASVVHKVPSSSGQSADVGAQAFTESRFGHDFSRIRAVQATDASTRPAALVSLPRLGADETTIFVNQPPPGGGRAPGAPPAAPTGDSCAKPFDMVKVTSGPFQGGYTMDDYFPQHKGKGLWSHPGTAGPFDTGSRAGSNVQLYGTFPSPCRPEMFSLAQTVTHDKAVFNGVRDSDEGKTTDDIADAKLDATGPPFRREWLGGGFNVSIADPPSLLYSAVSNAEWDRTFVTSLAGPGGRASVTWRTSIRVVNGKLTRNTVG